MSAKCATSWPFASGGTVFKIHCALPDGHEGAHRNYLTPPNGNEVVTMAEGVVLPVMVAEVGDRDAGALAMAHAKAFLEERRSSIGTRQFARRVIAHLADEGWAVVPVAEVDRAD